MKTQIIHFLAGCLTAIISITNPLLSIFLFLSFFIYELTEFYQIKDTIHKDILSYCVGLYISSLFILISNLIPNP